MTVATQDFPAIAYRIRRQRAIRRYLDYYEDTPWAKWCVEVLPDTFVPQSGEFLAFADFHREFWEWVWEIEPGEGIDALVPVWGRDAGKSRSVEAAVVYLAGEKKRRFGIYVCSTQPRADEHLASIAGLLERPEVQQRYPDLCEKATSKFGVAKGWNVTMLRTKLGFSMASAGLDKAVRGSRLDDQRPDLQILDDIDDDRDSASAVAKKEITISRAIIPSGDRGKTALVFAQNLVHDNSVMTRVLDDKADFLRQRRVSGPWPAVIGLKYTDEINEAGKRICTITEGTPTWEGMSLSDCETMMNAEGPLSFLAERQHVRGAKSGALWTRDMIQACRRDMPTHLVRICVNIDPEASGDAQGSQSGISVTARAADGHGYLLADYSDHYKGTTKGTSEGGIDMIDRGWGQKIVDLVEEWDADCVVAEINQGGDMVRSIIHLINPNVSVQTVHAKRGKHLRAEAVAQLYWRGLIHHVGVFQGLEDQMCEPYDPNHPTITWDSMDSVVYGFRFLLVEQTEALRALDPNKHRTERPTTNKKPLTVLGD